MVAWGIFFYIMKKEQEIRERLTELRLQKSYLEDFISSAYKGSATKQKAEKELLPFYREIKALEWVLYDELPF